MEGRTSVLKHRKPLSRWTVAGLTAASALALTGCSAELNAQWARWGLPEAASEQAPHIENLWVGSWIASMIIGAFVWGLIFWVMFRYRKKSDDQVPRQTRYNLPMELLYTLVPFLIIGVLFFYTVQAQNAVLAKATGPVHEVNVIGQKWSWTFNYMEAQNPAVGAVVYEAGTIERIPDLYLPVNKPVRFNLASADVIHSFWVPQFQFKLDVIPGLLNSFDVTPNREGVFLAKCAELCGTYHAAMLFNVHVVSEAEYVTYLKGLAAKGQVGEKKPPAYPNTIPTAPAEKEGER
ncbi:MAG: cytochrome c oxidase subunit II [Micropruina sp.]|nr:cytochrome c oxidase subunit II [Micropruina sp.]